MRSTLRLLLGLVAPILLVFVAACDNSAERAYQMAMDLEKYRADLDAQTLETPDGIRWHILTSEGGLEAPVVLLIHGFGADASNWLRFAGQLDGDFSLVVPDLAGHGETTRDLSLDYRMAAQSQRLFTLMDTLGVDQFHVAGNSMGGAISLAMARQAPQRVLSLGLIDSAGLTRQTQEFKSLLANSDANPLIPRQPEDFHTTLRWAMEAPPYMPEFFVDLMGKKKADNAAVAETIFEQLDTDPGMSLEGTGKLAAVKTPALVVWGRRDRLLGVDNVEVFLKELPDARAAILDGIGHLPMAEAPEKTADLFETFWLENGARQ